MRLLLLFTLLTTLTLVVTAAGVKHRQADRKLQKNPSLRQRWQKKIQEKSGDIDDAPVDLQRKGRNFILEHMDRLPFHQDRTEPSTYMTYQTHWWDNWLTTAGSGSPLTTPSPDNNESSDCPADKVQCPDGVTCIDEQSLCDTVIDCPDAFDEINGCPDRHWFSPSELELWNNRFNATECPWQYMQRCPSGTGCVNEGRICDGHLNCLDGSDERNCTGEIDPRCPYQKPGFVRCPSFGTVYCIPEGFFCDGIPDCDNGQDERNCTGDDSETPVCPSHLVSCPGGDWECVYEDQLCDGWENCQDRSDERNCTELRCPERMVPCPGGEWRCIWEGTICNGWADCHDGSDEANCTETTLPPTTTTSTTTTTTTTTTPSCTEVLTGQIGHVTSPGYPDNYPNNIDCGYKITTAEGSVVHLTFWEYHLENHSTCLYDYIKVFDGQNSSAPALTHKLCGEGSEHSVISHSNVIFVQFHTDHSVQNTGFLAVWAELVPSISCNTQGNTPPLPEETERHS